MDQASQVIMTFYKTLLLNVNPVYQYLVLLPFFSKHQWQFTTTEPQTCRSGIWTSRSDTCY